MRCLHLGPAPTRSVITARRRGEEENAAQMRFPHFQRGLLHPREVSSGGWQTSFERRDNCSLAREDLLLSQLSLGPVWGSECRLGAEAPAKIEGVTLMRPIHSNL